jgi:haloacetate dehalogenase
MFEGFALQRIEVADGVTIRVRHGGNGPALVLLHGHPRTHTTWHRVAPALAQDFTVICPDLRGYGQSSKPETDAAHSPYSKRAMGDDIASLLSILGHEQFTIAGHDRGSYVALRLALDHPSRVRKLAVLDSVPIGEALNRADARFAGAWWHWFFLGQVQKPAERVINADPLAWYGGNAGAMGAENFADYLAAISDPAVVHAMCEDYRTGLGIDRDHDMVDMANGRRLHCPVLMLWSSRDDLTELYGNPLEIWKSWADDLRGGAIESGHHMAEEAPEKLAESLRTFTLGLRD